MKTGKVIANYFLKTTVDVSVLMSMNPRNFSREDFHNLRIGIKKMRALFGLLHDVAGNSKTNKIPSSISRLYDQAGRVRLLQIELSLLNKFDQDRRLKSFETHLQEQMTKAEEDFSKFHYKNDTVSAWSENMEMVFMKIRKREVIRYIGKNIREIRKLTQPSKLKTAKLHDLRMRLKELYFILDSANLKEDELGFHHGRSLHKMIGDWHDWRLMRKHLEKAAEKKFISPDEKKHILLVSGKLKKKARQLTKIIDRKRHKLF